MAMMTATGEGGTAMAMRMVTASEVASKTILMGHPGSSSHVPVVRSFFKIFVPNFHLNRFVIYTVICRYYQLIISKQSPNYFEITSYFFVFST